MGPVPANSYMEVRCSPGYKYTEPHVYHFCRADGTFEDGVGRCVGQQSQFTFFGCNVPAIKNGVVDPYSLVSVGKRVTVTCNEGYEYSQAENNIRCLPSGVLESGLGQCVKLDNPADEGCTEIVLSNSRVDPPGLVPVDTWVFVDCFTGYSYSLGDSWHLCSYGGQYMSDVGECVADVTETVVTVEGCKEEAISNGHVIPAGNVPRGMWVQVLCEEGHIYSLKSNYHFCNEEGRYSNGFGGCTEEEPIIEIAPTITVDAFTEQPYQQVPTFGPGSTEPAKRESCEELQVENGRAEPSGVINLGTWVQIKCDAGYEYSEAERYHLCDFRGQYISKRGVCQKKEAPAACQVPVIHDSVMVPSTAELPLNSWVTVYCNTGYYYSLPTAYHLCQGDGTWQEDFGTCISEVRMTNNNTVKGWGPKTGEEAVNEAEKFNKMFNVDINDQEDLNSAWLKAWLNAGETGKERLPRPFNINTKAPGASVRDQYVTTSPQRSSTNQGYPKDFMVIDYSVKDIGSSSAAEEVTEEAPVIYKYTAHARETASPASMTFSYSMTSSPPLAATEAGNKVSNESNKGSNETIKDEDNPNAGTQSSKTEIPVVPMSCYEPTVEYGVPEPRGNIQEGTWVRIYCEEGYQYSLGEAYHLCDFGGNYLGEIGVCQESIEEESNNKTEEIKEQVVFQIKEGLIERSYCEEIVVDNGHPNPRGEVAIGVWVKILCDVGYKYSSMIEYHLCGDNGQYVLDRGTCRKELSSVEILKLLEETKPESTKEAQGMVTKDFDAWAAEVIKVKPTEVIKVKPTEFIKVKPTEVTKVKPTEFIKVKPTEFIKVKPTEVTKVKPTEFIKVIPTEFIKVKPTEVIKVKPTEVINVKPTEVTIVEPTNVIEEVLGTSCEEIKVTNSYTEPTGNVTLGTWVQVVCDEGYAYSLDVVFHLCNYNGEYTFPPGACQKLAYFVTEAIKEPFVKATEAIKEPFVNATETINESFEEATEAINESFLEANYVTQIKEDKTTTKVNLPQELIEELRKIAEAKALEKEMRLREDKRMEEAKQTAKEQWLEETKRIDEFKRIEALKLAEARRRADIAKIEEVKRLEDAESMNEERRKQELETIENEMRKRIEDAERLEETKRTEDAKRIDNENKKAEIYRIEEAKKQRIIDIERLGGARENKEEQEVLIEAEDAKITEEERRRTDLKGIEDAMRIEAVIRMEAANRTAETKTLEKAERAEEAKMIEEALRREEEEGTEWERIEERKRLEETIKLEEVKNMEEEKMIDEHVKEVVDEKTSCNELSIKHGIIAPQGEVEVGTWIEIKCDVGYEYSLSIYFHLCDYGGRYDTEHGECQLKKQMAETDRQVYIQISTDSRKVVTDQATTDSRKAVTNSPNFTPAEEGGTNSATTGATPEGPEEDVVSFVHGVNCSEIHIKDGVAEPSGNTAVGGWVQIICYDGFRYSMDVNYYQCGEGGEYTEPRGVCLKQDQSTEVEIVIIGTEAPPIVTEQQYFRVTDAYFTEQITEEIFRVTDEYISKQMTEIIPIVTTSCEEIQLEHGFSEPKGEVAFGTWVQIRCDGGYDYSLGSTFHLCDYTGLYTTQKGVCEMKEPLTEVLNDTRTEVDYSEEVDIKEDVKESITPRENCKELEIENGHPEPRGEVTLGTWVQIICDDGYEYSVMVYFHLCDYTGNYATDKGVCQKSQRETIRYGPASVTEPIQYIPEDNPTSLNDVVIKKNQHFKDLQLNISSRILDILMESSEADRVTYPIYTVNPTTDTAVEEVSDGEKGLQSIPFVHVVDSDMVTRGPSTGYDGHHIVKVLEDLATISDINVIRGREFYTTEESYASSSQGPGGFGLDVSTDLDFKFGEVTSAGVAPTDFKFDYGDVVSTEDNLSIVGSELDLMNEIFDVDIPVTAPLSEVHLSDKEISFVVDGSQESQIADNQDHSQVANKHEIANSLDQSKGVTAKPVSKQSFKDDKSLFEAETSTRSTARPFETQSNYITEKQGPTSFVYTTRNSYTTKSAFTYSQERAEKIFDKAENNEIPESVETASNSQSTEDNYDGNYKDIYSIADVDNSHPLTDVVIEKEATPTSGEYVIAHSNPPPTITRPFRATDYVTEEVSSTEEASGGHLQPESSSKDEGYCKEITIAYSDVDPIGNIPIGSWVYVTCIEGYIYTLNDPWYLCNKDGEYDSLVGECQEFVTYLYPEATQPTTVKSEPTEDFEKVHYEDDEGAIEETTPVPSSTTPTKHKMEDKEDLNRLVNEINKSFDKVDDITEELVTSTREPYPYYTSQQSMTLSAERNLTTSDPIQISTYKEDNSPNEEYNSTGNDTSVVDNEAFYREGERVFYCLLQGVGNAFLDPVG